MADQTGRDADVAHPNGQLAARVVVSEFSRIMATDITVQIAAPPEQEAEARAAAQECMDFFTEVDERLSRFKSESELSRLNRAADEWVPASELLFACVALALDAARASDGLFDPTLLRHIEALGYDRDFAEIARRETPRSPGTATEEAASSTAAAPGGWRGIELDRARQRICLPSGVGLDLGGIAKGWAADVAFERFCARFPGALLNLGGDLRLYGGPQPGQPWSVGIRDPRTELEPGDPTYIAVIAFSRGGLATSGAVSRWWLRDGRRRHHLLDPRTGEPIRLWIDGEPPDASADSDDAGPGIATITALAPTGARAEVAAKLALLRGYPEALRRVEEAWERHGALQPAASDDALTSPDVGVALLIAFGNGDVVLSKNMPQYLATWGTEGASLPLRVSPSL